jgi:hypothetical protein
MQGRHRRVLYGRNDPVQRGAAEITEHTTDTGAERTDEGASQAAGAVGIDVHVIARGELAAAASAQTALQR